MLFTVLVSLVIVSIIASVLWDRLGRCEQCGGLIWTDVADVSPTWPSPVGVAIRMRVYRCRCGAADRVYA